MFQHAIPVRNHAESPRQFVPLYSLSHNDAGAQSSADDQSDGVTKPLSLA